MQAAFEHTVAGEVFVIADFRGIDPVEDWCFERRLDEGGDGFGGCRIFQTFREMPSIVRALDAEGLVTVFDADAGDVIRIEIKQRGARLNDALGGKAPAVCCAHKDRKASGCQHEKDGGDAVHARRLNQTSSPRIAANRGMPTTTRRARRDI